MIKLIFWHVIFHLMPVIFSDWYFCWVLKTIIIVTGEQRRQGPDNVDLNRRAIYHHTKMEAPSKPLHMGKNSNNFTLVCVCILEGTFCFWYKKVKIKGFFLQGNRVLDKSVTDWELATASLMVTRTRVRLVSEIWKQISKKF